MNTLNKRLLHHLDIIYPDHDTEKLAKAIIAAYWPNKTQNKPLKNPKQPSFFQWDEADNILITYGDSIIQDGKHDLQTLKAFLDKHLRDEINGVHILPFFPYSSDDGFAVMDYKAVNEKLGNWKDIATIGTDYKLMSDLVLNHASSRGTWFGGYLSGDPDYKNFFFTANPDDDISQVVRPRPSPLLTSFDTHDGIKHLWCTFGPDQVDLNFANPKVLIAFIEIMRLYIDNNVRVFRMDAVAFLWKQVGTPSIHMPQTHEIIRLFRTLMDFSNDTGLTLITETNVPNLENISYFGNQNEAHLVYNFSLPPLLIHALLTGENMYLKRWLMLQPPAQEGCTYLNFVASHDGIGLRPATRVLPEADIDSMIRTIRSFGGEISMRSTEDGGERPYEMNIALFDALKGTIAGGEDDLQRQRFLASQTIMMGLEGIPAIYIHSLLATPNDLNKFRETGHKRHINRHQWDAKALDKALKDKKSDQYAILNEMKRLLSIRKRQPAFHPNGIQFTLQVPEGFFGFWRQSICRKQDIFCLTNLSHKERSLPLHHLNLYTGQAWLDLITGQTLDDPDHDLILAPYQTLWIANCVGPVVNG